VAYWPSSVTVGEGADLLDIEKGLEIESRLGRVVLLEQVCKGDNAIIVCALGGGEGTICKAQLPPCLSASPKAFENRHGALLLQLLTHSRILEPKQAQT
jgi:hypothetical protein